MAKPATDERRIRIIAISGQQKPEENPKRVTPIPACCGGVAVR